MHPGKHEFGTYFVHKFNSRPRIIPGHTGAQYLLTYGTGHTKGHTAILKSKIEDWKQIQNKETHFKKSKQESRIKNSENKKN